MCGRLPLRVAPRRTWLWLSLMASIAASFTNRGASQSGNPCPRLTAATNATVSQQHSSDGNGELPAPGHRLTSMLTGEGGELCPHPAHTDTKRERPTRQQSDRQAFQAGATANAVRTWGHQSPEDGRGAANSCSAHSQRCAALQSARHQHGERQQWHASWKQLPTEIAQRVDGNECALGHEAVEIAKPSPPEAGFFLPELRSGTSQRWLAAPQRCVAGPCIDTRCNLIAFLPRATPYFSLSIAICLMRKPATPALCAEAAISRPTWQVGSYSTRRSMPRDVPPACNPNLKPLGVIVAARLRGQESGRRRQQIIKKCRTDGYRIHPAWQECDTKGKSILVCGVGKRLWL